MGRFILFFSVLVGPLVLGQNSVDHSTEAIPVKSWQPQKNLDSILDSLPKYNRCDLVQQLGKLGVFVEKDDPKIFDQSMLLNLISYVTIAQPKTPIYLYATDKSGPTLVWLRNGTKDMPGTHLDFATNAGESLITKGVSDAIEDTKNLSGPVIAEIKFSNALFEQLSRVLLSEAEVKKLIEQGMSVSLDADPSEQYAKYTSNFSQQELIALMKAVKDLPDNIRQGFALKRIVRMKPGYNLPEGDMAAADYNESTQVIRMTDKAFHNDENSLGEGTFTHELGHALWQRMSPELQNKFIQISWNKDANGQYQLKSGVVKTVSDYSTTSPKEDFAEHFAAFVRTPEKLKSLAPEKYAYMQKLFGDTRYETRANEKAQISIHSDNPDTTPPTWIPQYMPFARSPMNLTATCTNTEFDSQHVPTKAVIKVHIEGVKDDNSGIHQINVNFGNREGGDWGCRMFLGSGECIDPKNGIYEGSREVNLYHHDKGTYNLDALWITDNAKNETKINPSNLNISFHIDGRKEKQKLSLNLSFDQIKTTTTHTDEGTVVDMELPFAVTDSNAIIQLTWTDPVSRASFEYTIHTDGRTSFFKEEDGKTKVRILFPKQIPSARFELSKIRVQTFEDSHRDNNSVESKDRDKGGGISIFHTSTAQPQKPRIDLNNMALSEDKGTGGTTSIVLDVPVSCINNKNNIFKSVVIQSPNGKEFNSLSASSYSTEVIEVDGRIILRFKVGLPPNYESGVYTIKKIRVANMLEKVSGANVPVSFDFQNTTVVPSEIGIAAKIIIRKPSFDPEKSRIGTGN